MAKYFEIIIFTAALKDYADWILEKIDVKNNISHKLYRQHATNNGTFFLKVLLILNDFSHFIQIIWKGFIKNWKGFKENNHCW